LSANEENTIKVLKEGEYDVSDFIRKTERDVEEMWTELASHIGSVKNPEIKKVVDHFFRDEDFIKRFRIAPAAMYIHHGWASGLLEHTLSVTNLALAMQKIHPTMDRDLVIAGALLHDIGKLEEFEVKTSITVTTKGMLIGHVTIGVRMLTDAMEKLETPEILRMKLTHILLTHMGEYGSSKLPSFPEAMAVHYADQADAKLTQMITLKEDASTEDDHIYSKDLGNVYLL